MTRPEQIKAMRDALAEVGRASASFRAALPVTNDPTHQAFFSEVLGRIDQIIRNEGVGVTLELAGDLLKARQDLRRLRLPEIDPDLDAPTPPLSILRGERGNLVEALENALDAAKALGMAPRLAEFGEMQVPRQLFAEQLIRLDERLRVVQESVDELRTATERADSATGNGQVTQKGLFNLHIEALTVEVSAARFETRTGDNPAIPANADLAALARTTEAIRDIARDLKETAIGLRDWITPAVGVISGMVARAAERSWGGVRALIRFARRRFSTPEKQSADAPSPFDPDEVYRLILAGQAPPAAWVPFIEGLHFNGKPLIDLSPLAGLSSLNSLWLNETGVTDLSPLAGLSSLQRLSLNQTIVTDLSPLAGLSKLTVVMNGREFSPARGEGPAEAPRQPGKAARRSARPVPR